MSESGNARNASPDVSIADAFVEYYGTNGAGFGSVDILCCGTTRTHERISALAGALSRHDESYSRVSRFLVVLPPDAQGGAVPEDLLRLGSEVALPGNSGRSSNSQESNGNGDRVKFVRAPDLRTQSLLAKIQGAERRSVVIVTEAAEYRAEDVAPYTSPEVTLPALPEDFWVPQLHALAAAVMHALEDEEVFVVLDAGRWSPHRHALREILQSIDGCGVLAAGVDDDPEALIASRIDEWNVWFSNGRLGAILKGIDDLPVSLDAEKPFLRVQFLHRARLERQVLAVIENELPSTENANPTALVKLARIAHDAGSSMLAEKLLGQTIDAVNSFEVLESALVTASGIDDAELEDRIAARLEALFPHSPGLRRHRAAALLSVRNYRDAAAMLANVPGSAEVSRLYSVLSDSLRADGVPDYTFALKETARLMPAQTARAHIVCIRDALSRGLLVHALTMAGEATMSDDVARQTASLLLDVTERLLLERDATGGILVDIEDLKMPIIRVIEYLSTNLADGRTRLRLAHVLSLQVSGSNGLPLITVATIELSAREPSLRESLASRECSLVDLLARSQFLDAAFAWLQTESPVVIGRTILPEELVTEPPDEVVPELVQLIGNLGRRLEDESAIADFYTWLTLASALIPHSSDPDQDIPMMQLAANRLVLAGQVQHARDLAEQILQQAGCSPRRNRLAWFAMADIYNRLGNHLESCIYLACGFATDGEIEKEELLHEGLALARLLRDVGLRDMARDGLKSARALVHRLDLHENYLVRLHTLEIQLDMTDFLEDSDRSRASFLELLRKTETNARAVLASGDDPNPVATILGQLLRKAEMMSLDPGPNAAETLRALLDQGESATESFVQLVSVPHPRADDVLAFVKRLETARYSDDVGYDVGNPVLLARRLLSGKEAAENPVVAVFAMELLTDLSIAVPGWESTASPPHVPTSLDVPSAIAKELSLTGMYVVMAGLDSASHLLRVTAASGQLGDVVREDEEVFSAAQLRSWAKEFPYRYGVEENAPNLFYTSTEGLGVADLPKGRVLLVTDAELQELPPNLLRVRNEFAGQLRPMAAAPSLSWLAAARQRAGGGSGRQMAWIPSGEKHGRTLTMIADRLGPTLEEYGFGVDRGSTLPAGLSGCEIAVIAAHGSIAPEGRYFQLIADDADLRIGVSSLASVLRNVSVVVLFVCSGGRVDKHPSANTVVGLAKKILDRGCSAVVASPWPLDARVTYHWFPEFIRVWTHGQPLIDANFAANMAVKQGLGDDPARCLAMSVYGDPLCTKNA